MWLVKLGETNSAFSPVSGCTRTTGWTDRMAPSRELLGQLAGHLAPQDRQVVVVHGVEAVDEVLHLRRQLLVGGGEVGPLRVAAVRRHDEAPQDRRHRRLGHERDVGVPAALDRRAAGLVAAPGTARLVVEQQDLGVVGERRQQRRVAGDELAERPAEREVLLLGEGLVAEEHDLPLEQRGADGGDRLGRELAEVDAVDLGADVAGHRAHVEPEVAAGVVDGRHRIPPDRSPGPVPGSVEARRAPARLRSAGWPVADAPERSHEPSTSTSDGRSPGASAWSVRSPARPRSSRPRRAAAWPRPGRPGRRRRPPVSPGPRPPPTPGTYESCTALFGLTAKDSASWVMFDVVENRPITPPVTIGGDLQADRDRARRRRRGRRRVRGRRARPGPPRRSGSTSSRPAGRADARRHHRSLPVPRRPRVRHPRRRHGPTPPTHGVNLLTDPITVSGASVRFLESSTRLLDRERLAPGPHQPLAGPPVPTTPSTRCWRSTRTSATPSWRARPPGRRRPRRGHRRRRRPRRGVGHRRRCRVPAGERRASTDRCAALDQAQSYYFGTATRSLTVGATATVTVEPPPPPTTSTTSTSTTHRRRPPRPSGRRSPPTRSSPPSRDDRAAGEQPPLPPDGTPTWCVRLAPLPGGRWRVKGYFDDAHPLGTVLDAPVDTTGMFEIAAADLDAEGRPNLWVSTRGDRPRRAPVVRAPDRPRRPPPERHPRRLHRRPRPRGHGRERRRSSSTCR